MTDSEWVARASGEVLSRVMGGQEGFEVKLDAAKVVAAIREARRQGGEEMREMVLNLLRGYSKEAQKDEEEATTERGRLEANAADIAVRACALMVEDLAEVEL